MDIKFDERGLICAIAQDAESGDVLMQAYMNEEALEKTLETGYAHYWSRSRKCLWKKGETSGHVQKVKGITFDCDKDCVLLQIEQVGAACHTGSRSCFFNVEKAEEGAGVRFLSELERVIDDRKKHQQPAVLGNGPCPHECAGLALPAYQSVGSHGHAAHDAPGHGPLGVLQQRPP